MNTVLPPQELRAEQAVIGSMLLESSTIRPVADVLTSAAMLYEPTAQAVFKAIMTLYDRESPVDITTVLAEMGTTDKEVTAYLGGCCDVLSNVEHATYYAQLVAAAYRDREIISHASALVHVMYESKPGDPKELLAKITAEVVAKEALGVPQTFDYSKDLGQVLEALEAEKCAEMIDTGIPGIDGAWRGTMPGEVNTWGAATNVGKSVMLLNLAHSAAIRGHRCLYVGTEMSAKELVTRHLAIVASLPAWKLRSVKKLTADDRSRIVEVVGDKMTKYPLHILDHPEPNLAQIEAAIVASKAEVVFLDYLERFSLPREKELRLQIKEFMRKLKTLARRRNVVVHLAAQLGRTVYGQEEKCPTLADLSESNAIEKESDRVVLMWRPKAKQGNQAVIDCIQAKNRHGKRGTVVTLTLDNETLRITGEVGPEAKNED